MKHIVLYFQTMSELYQKGNSPSLIIHVVGVQGVELSQHNLVVQCLTMAVDGESFYRAFGKLQVYIIKKL